MATEQNIALRQGRTGTLACTVTGVSDWTDYASILIAKTQDSAKTEIIRLTGSIDSGTGIITFPYTFDDTDGIENDAYSYEVIVYKTDKTVVQTPTYGTLQIIGAVQIDPTV